MGNGINLNFKMAKQNYADEVLRTIAKEALDFLLKNVNANRIKCILITGSLANSEGTVIKHGSSLVISDFDFVAYLDVPHYLKSRSYFRKLSEAYTRFIKKRVCTRIEFLPFASLLQTIIWFANSGIYEYEFAFASRCVFGKTPSFNKEARPTKEDALELTFTVISDLVFSNLKNLSKIEETYAYAKRALTLLNSILIFHGYFAETYEKRMNIAKVLASRGVIPINQDEIKILEIFTEYKLSGSLYQLLDSLSCNNIEDLIRFQKEFLKNLATKILYYELSNIFVKAKQIKAGCNKSHKSKLSLSALLKEYSKYSRTRLLSKSLGIALYLFWSLARNKEIKELFATFVFHKQPPKVLLNVLITLLLIYESKVSVKKYLKEMFPWMELSLEIEPIQRIFSLWQIAEQSIKL